MNSIDPENMVEFLSKPFTEKLSDVLKTRFNYRNIKLSVIQKHAISALLCHNDNVKLGMTNTNEFVETAFYWLKSDNEFYRQTGRTTALSFYYLMQALNNEGVWIKNIQEFDPKLQTVNITNNLAKVIKDIAKDFELLEYLEVRTILKSSLPNDASYDMGCEICINRQDKFDKNKKEFLGVL